MLVNARTERAKPSPHHMAQGQSRVVVRSIGTSGVALVRSLRQVMMLAEPDIAALLLQAPSTLMTGMEHGTAESVAALLRDTGLDCAVLEPDSDASLAWSEGVGDHEVALHIHDFSHMPAIVLEIMHLLGVDAHTAHKIACAVPAPLLGGVSAATVAALRVRFAPLGAEIDASRPEQTCFDLFMAPSPAALHDRIGARLRMIAGEGAESLLTGGVLSGIEREVAVRILHELRPLSIPLRVVNRDFARYAVMLRQASDSPALRACLARSCGMPPAVVPQVLANLPMVLHHHLPHAETEAILAELVELGAVAVAEPTALQRFALELDAVRDPAMVAPLLRDIGDLAEAEVMATLRQHQPRFAGPFTPTQAHWLVHELRRAGAVARLESL